MIELKSASEKTVRRETFEFEEPFGGWRTKTWTRVTINGKLDRWVPHDEYGELPASSSASGETKEKLEEAYQQSDWS